MTSPRSRTQRAGLQNLDVTWKGDSLPASPHCGAGTAVTSCDKLTAAISTPEGGSGRGAARAEGTEAQHARHPDARPGSVSFPSVLTLTFPDSGSGALSAPTLSARLPPPPPPSALRWGAARGTQSTQRFQSPSDTEGRRPGPAFGIRN